MSNVTRILFAAQTIAIIILANGAFMGNTAMRLNGLHVQKLAYDNVGLAIMVSCLISCVVATVFVQRVVKSWKRVEVLGFLLSCAVGWLSASAYANATSGFSINGASPRWVSSPCIIWLAVLFIVVIISRYIERTA